MLRKGFTLIELLIVVVIIGILATVVLPRFSDVREKAYVSAMQNDLRNLITAQELYFADNGSYATDASTVMSLSDNVAIQITVDGDGYTAVATHGGADYECLLNRTNGAASLGTSNTNVEAGKIECVALP